MKSDSATPDPGALLEWPAPKALLDWYDAHRRDLPWRARPGEHADPYRVWLSEIMLQQTTVRAVGPYFARFLERFPDVGALAAAPSEDVMKAWAGLGYYSRARNLHRAARIVADDLGGRFPETEEGLRDLPGIGPYTAAAIAAIAFDRPAAPVDGNIERVIARLHAIETPLPAAKAEIKARASALVPEDRPGDFAQGMMDLGAMVCTPKSPACALCPWMDVCRGRALGIAETLPVKPPKAEKPKRRGIAFVAIRDDGAVLTRRRPPRGLLGGMTEVPGSDWITGETMPDARPPIAGDWDDLDGVVRHVFTHFALELSVRRRHVNGGAAPSGHTWIGPDDLADAAFPTVMRKVLHHAGIDLPARHSKR